MFGCKRPVVIGGWREIFPIILGKEGNVYEK
jgi:hypothetical protein